MSLEATILALLLLRNGDEIIVCRPHCAAHAAVMAHAVEQASYAHDIDALMLVAVGFRESSLLARESPTGKGFFGWHPSSRLWRECSGQCDLELQADLTARELSGLKGECGSTYGALSAWQSGKCESASGNRYARRVLRLEKQLRSRVRAPQYETKSSCGAPCTAVVPHASDNQAILACVDTLSQWVTP